MFWIQNYGLNEAYCQLLVTLILFQYAVLICYTSKFMYSFLLKKKFMYSFKFIVRSEPGSS
jgi:hypothetical protein